MSYNLNITPRHSVILSLDDATFTVRYSAAAITRLQEELDRPMSGFGDWLRISVDEMPVVLAAGLEANHEDAHQIAGAICDSLEAETFDRLVQTLSVAVFPREVECFYGVLASLQPNAEASPSVEGSVV